MADILYQQRKVRKGDTLSDIAEQLLGSSSRWNEIYEANRDILSDPNKIKVGQQLRIPGSEPSAPAVGQPQKPPGDVPLQPVANKTTSFLDKTPKPARVDPLPAGGVFVEGMMRRGWSAEEAAGAAGNVHVESGFQPGIKSSVPGEGSYGFLQWNSARLRGLQTMAEMTGRDWTDPEVQMDWIQMERNGESTKFGGSDERRMYEKAFSGGGTPEDIAERFGQYVERPRRLADTVEIRKAAAARYGYIDDVTNRLIGG